MPPGDFFNDSTPAAALVTPPPRQHRQHQHTAKQPPAAPPAPTTPATTTTATSGPASDGTGTGIGDANNVNNNNETTSSSNHKTAADYISAFPHLTDLDKRILALPSDAAFTPHTWTDLQRLLAANALDQLTRTPSQTRAYLDWSAAIRRQHGSILTYLLRERLRWTPTRLDPDIAFVCADPNGIPFAHPDDVKVLRNDWPYGVEEGIVHLCVWLKTRLQLRDDGQGDLTEEARGMVEAFVEKTFRGPVGEGVKGERVLWFKNWGALQSVRGVDHVHVLVRDAPPELLEGWMN
ncbi:hypothetical protein BK809_0001295 [Diplodia seriata]|uniref:N-acetylglucosamine-induced protein 1 n=1 Tax=Diplodia seriata TaxID=420778 RepID=A0A1S8B8L4_9PEZI|nr:hypothetical protein BK809_0001295 [Diplodia seriata]